MMVTTGLRWAPEIGPKARIRATSAAPVATVFARSAKATFALERRSAMIPEPITAATSNRVPKNSAVARRDSERLLMPDAVYFFLDCETIESRKRQTQEQTDSSIEHQVRISKRLFDLFWCSSNCCRI